MNGALIVWMIIYLGVAWTLYALDRKRGVKWYNWWCGISTEGLAKTSEKGFICQRPVSFRFMTATILSTKFILLISIFSEVGMLNGFFIWLFGILVIAFGFLTGPIFLRLWGRRVNVFEVIGDYEKRFNAGDYDLVKSGQRQYERSSSWVKNQWNRFITWIFEYEHSLRVEGTSSNVQKENPQEAPAPPVVTENASPEDLMADFLGTRNKREEA